MFTVTDAHIDLVLDDLSAKGLMTDDLRNNIVDHICILAERDLRDEEDFEAYYRQIIPTFYRQHLGEIEEETQFLLNHPKCFALLDRLQFFLLLAAILLGPIICWIVATFRTTVATKDGIVPAWEAGLVFALFPVLLLIVLFLTPDRYDPLIPRRAKIILGWKPFISIATPGLFFLFVSFFPVSLFAQNGIWESRDAYLALPRPSDTPRIFAPGMLADTGIALDRVAFSADGKEFYYCYADHWFNAAGAKVKYFRFRDGRWEGPFVQNEGLYGPSFSNDGKTMYFLGRKGEVWESARKGEGWAKPSIYLKTNFGLYDFMPVKRAHFYIATNYGHGSIQDWSSYDFSVLRVSGKDTVVRDLGRPLNTAGFDGDFYIAPDESFMIVSANETKDFECELYISFSKPDGSWTNPKSLGPLINDGVAHRWGQYVTPDGKYLFYTRGTSEKDCHILWARFDGLLGRLRHTNFAPYVSRPLEDRQVRRNTVFRWAVQEGIFIDDDGNSTLSYTAGLEGGQPLPDWLSFDPKGRMFSGAATGIGTYRVTVTATDPAGATAQSSFLLQVVP